MNRYLATAAVVLVTAGLVSVAGVANADSAITGSYGGVNRITASYTTSNNQLHVKDLVSDGYGGVSNWFTANGGQGQLLNSSGVNITTNLTIPEPVFTQIKYNACVKNGSTVLACTPSYATDFLG